MTLKKMDSPRNPGIESECCEDTLGLGILFDIEHRTYLELTAHLQNQLLPQQYERTACISKLEEDLRYMLASTPTGLQGMAVDLTNLEVNIRTIPRTWKPHKTALQELIRQAEASRDLARTCINEYHRKLSDYDALLENEHINPHLSGKISLCRQALHELIGQQNLAIQAFDDCIASASSVHSILYKPQEKPPQDYFYS